MRAQPYVVRRVGEHKVQFLAVQGLQHFWLAQYLQHQPLAFQARVQVVHQGLPLCFQQGFGPIGKEAKVQRLRLSGTAGLRERKKTEQERGKYRSDHQSYFKQYVAWHRLFICQLNLPCVLLARLGTLSRKARLDS